MTNKTQKLPNAERIVRRNKIVEMRKTMSVRQITKETGWPKWTILRDLSDSKRYPNNEDLVDYQERRDKILELNNAYKTHTEIATTLKISPAIVLFELYRLKRQGKRVIRGNEIAEYKAKQRAAIPEPDKLVKCSYCDGTGRRNGQQTCNICFGDGKIDSFYGNIVKENVDLLTIKTRLKAARWLMKYLCLDDWQQLATWYLKFDTLEENNRYFEKIVGAGFVGEELVKVKKVAVRSQTRTVWELQHIYELNGITTLPWQRIYQYAKVPADKEKKPEYDKAYTAEQIKKLYDNSNLTYKAVISFYMSGCRRGALYQVLSAVDRIKYPERERFLRIKDLKDPLEDLAYEQRRDFLLKIPEYEESPIYEMRIYSEDLSRDGEPVYYTCWSTPEYHNLVNQMLAKRQRDGELGTELKDQPFDIRVWQEKCPESPVFRTEYDIDHYKITHPEEFPLTYTGINAYLSRRRQDHLEPMKKRVKLFNGFRSYVETVLGHNVTPKLSEREIAWFMGRELPAMGEHYDAWGKLDQIVKWWGALEWLTIDKEKYLDKKIRQKDKIIEDKEIEIRERRRDQYLWDLKHEAMQERMDKLEGGLEKLLRYMGETPPERTLTNKEAPSLTSDEKMEKRLDRLEAMISKVIPEEERPKGKIEITSHALEDKIKHNNDGTTDQK
ncbi:hypothetical protein [Nitrososphaera sp. AFS]|uniref:hypothetical protein n=1 Tax=Nitrososphaera sp. AFS TaxID=2301191 RepID=UPI001392364B|nr:hypothetical protein [Nitrososphaera sp. AFS]NAL77284.1 hypothetical protein [Nitrososphaera sp. AFS]